MNAEIRIRELLSSHAVLDVTVESLSDTDDLYAHGLSSLATVELMLAIEDTFGIEIPEPLLNRSTFGTIDAIVTAVDSLR